MDVPQPLRAAAEALAQARAGGDAAALAGIATLFAEDGLLLLPYGTRLLGRAAIAAHFAALATPQGRGVPRQAALKISPAKFFFFPPLAHAVASANGRHGEKHSFIDIFSQQADGSYLLACSSWTLR